MMMNATLQSINFLGDLTYPQNLKLFKFVLTKVPG